MSAGGIELTGEDALTPAEVDRLLSTLNTSVAHNGRGDGGECPGCSAREKLERAQQKAEG